MSNSPTLSVRIQKNLHAAGSVPFHLDVTFTIPSGISILFGASGSGKSTTLDCIAGLQRPEQARIVIGESILQDTNKNINLPAEQRHIAYVFQSLALFPHLTVEENVAYGISDLPQAERRDRVNEILSSFHVEKLTKRKPAEISGGEKQRVALARSLVTRPRALLLDEPLTNLDAYLKDTIMEDLRAWNSTINIPVLYVTHSRYEVDTLGERVIAMDHGRIIAEGDTRDVLESPRKLGLAQSAGFENILPGVVAELNESDGVMRVRLHQTCELEIPLGNSKVGSAVRVAIRAGDILLASQKPSGLSAQNLLEGSIISLEQRGTLVIVRVSCGPVFSVHVTPRAVRSLQLAEGQKIWLVIKTHSCHVVQD
jgi:molybdate transport system ATP-binding protein